MFLLVRRANNLYPITPHTSTRAYTDKNSAASGVRSLDQNVRSGMRTHGIYHSAIRAVCSGGILRHINMNLMHTQTFRVSVESPIPIPCII